EHIKKYNEKDSEIVTAVDDLQTFLEYCGVEGPDDWKNITGSNALRSCCPKKPRACPIETKAYYSGCLSKLFDFIEYSIRIIAIILLLIATIEVADAILPVCSAVLIRHVRSGTSESKVKDDCLWFFAIAHTKAAEKEKNGLGVIFVDSGSMNSLRRQRMLMMCLSVFEMALHAHVYSCVKPAISKYQYGFLPKKSTVTSLLTSADKIAESAQNKSQIDVIYLDAGKAFNK
ncbi:hypothetical protein ILUMI_15797, partial [Ignelater luminosus]